MDNGDKIKKLIEESGNSFHFKVVELLRGKGWEVLVSPYYNDYISDKAKEIDIIAEKYFGVKDVFGKDTGNLRVRFFIECKYINNEIAFWFDDRDTKKARELVLQTTPLKEDNSYIDSHHYLKKDQVAKLFSSNSNKEDVVYKALTQSINSMLYFRYKHLPFKGKMSRNLCTINYPIILCNSFDNFFKVEKENEKTYSNINSNFQLEVNYAYLNESKKNMNDYFIIDIVDLNKIDCFLEELEKTDIHSVSEVIGWEWKNSNFN